MLDSEFWNQIYFSNTVFDYTVALGIFFGSLIVFAIFQFIVLKRAKALAYKTKTDIDDIIVKIIQAVRPPFYVFLSFWIALMQLSLQNFLRKVIYALLIIWAVYLLVQAIQVFITHISEKSDSNRDTAPLRFVGVLAKVIVWALGILLVLQNLGVNVTSLIAGLGIGGVAIALALQNILSDLFASFAIYLDKPFEVGDFIEVGEKSGTVKKIGVKTTRLQTMRGEELVLSNTELTSAKIHNFKALETRRVVFNFGVTYDLNATKLRSIPKLIRKIMKKHSEEVDFYGAYLREFGDSDLKYEVIYYLKSDDYKQYLKKHEEILLDIKVAFDREEVEFAFPTQVIYQQ